MARSSYDILKHVWGMFFWNSSRIDSFVLL